MRLELFLVFLYEHAAELSTFFFFSKLYFFLIFRDHPFWHNMTCMPKSFVWKKFDKVEGFGCKCVQCNAVLKYAASFTSGMAKHLCVLNSICELSKSSAVRVTEESVVPGSQLCHSNPTHCSGKAEREIQRDKEQGKQAPAVRSS